MSEQDERYEHSVGGAICRAHRRQDGDRDGHYPSRSGQTFTLFVDRDAWDLHLEATFADGEDRYWARKAAERPSFEQILRDPTSQMDPDGVVLSTILAVQRKPCSHLNRTTHPPATAGASAVTVCNSCGLYL